jgi:1,2-dihydroxy-3-keto-5-methylthiopentene dioxygenase
MATLIIPDQRKTLDAFSDIQAFLQARGILITQWEANEPLAENADETAVLSAYRHQLQPYMKAGGYQTADVICVNSETPNLPALREKFLKEHIHTEDEVRFFVAGTGYFWFNLESTEFVEATPPFCVVCRAGDLLSVPAGYKHWFDLGELPYVKAIRIFTDPAGWVPEYTHSGVEQTYQQLAVGE